MSDSTKICGLIGIATKAGKIVAGTDACIEEMISQGMEQSRRLERLNGIAKKQFDILQHTSGIKKIESLDNLKFLDK